MKLTGSTFDHRVLCFRPLSSGQLGEVYEVNGDRVAVILDIGNDNKEDELEKDEKLTEQPAKAPVYWIDAKDIEHDPDTEMEYCYIATEVLCEVLRSMQSLIVYFPDSSAVPKSNPETGSKEKERFTMVLPNIGRLAKLPLSLKHLTDGLKGEKRSNENDITKLFINVLCLNPPKEDERSLATEAGANFISITGSTFTSKRVSGLEMLKMLTKALFSFASKLAPVIIFVDEFLLFNSSLWGWGPIASARLCWAASSSETSWAVKNGPELGSSLQSWELGSYCKSFFWVIADSLNSIGVDSLLGARGGSFEHEATRRMRNEFMAAWDGLRSKDSQRILILGATNRPFDLDDAVIAGYLGGKFALGNTLMLKNRMKILRIILNRENLESDFQFHELANATEGYSGSDLKNLCIAAAYRPVEELLEEEKVIQFIFFSS
ncbi:P-LOOP CONTAINING NUCLEOSIDE TRIPHOSPHATE HYDROLASES SUPERFAMILY PROTEIN [Salix viminalis]|uniref:p-LOOP CONTAINING NUCLEOSIDE TRIPHOSPHATE HYDROLASES SUPERFAMILY PROTEIN n=1 Tax=Salix viminalis TaxID=40686 RepID=A0A9Q0NYG8_SALVM|nr:P-LOOP CONTAINING NUCLEOSIDE TRIPHOSPHATE HYDROLASES SUPERFAMILY PROTEIN [Salix viminalis]